MMVSCASIVLVVGTRHPTTASTTASTTSTCVPLTEAEVMLYSNVAWWLEGFLQISIGVVGFLANGLAVPILLSKEMNSIFNRLLVFLAVFDNFYIACALSEGVRKHSR